MKTKIKYAFRNASLPTGATAQPGNAAIPGAVDYRSVELNMYIVSF